MKLSFLISILLSCQIVDANNVSAETESVSVQYLGASGGMKVTSKKNSSKWIMVQQKMLEEQPAGQGKPNKLNMAGGDADWTELEKTTVEKVDTYTTTFTKSMGAARFALTAHISTGEIDITETVPCSGCNVSNGYCMQMQNVTNSTDKQLVCQGSNDNTTCANGFTKCEEQVTLPKDELKFSIQVHNWPFKSPESKLTYAITLKQKNEGSSVNVSGTTTRKLEIAGGGFLLLPTKGKIVGGSSEREITVGISTETVGSAFTINFEFPYFGPGETLYYDPNIGVESSNPAQSTASPGPGPTSVANSNSISRAISGISLILGVKAAFSHMFL